MTRYQPLFHIRCAHDYFADGNYRSAELRPTAHCSRLLNRYGCLFRGYPGGCSVYYETPPLPDAALLKSFAEITPLVFTLNGSPAELAEFTEIDPANAGRSSSSIACFSNVAENAATIDKKNFLLLHEPKNPFANGAVSIRAPQFDYPDCAGPVRLLNMLKDEVAILKEPRTTATGVSVDFAGVPEGRYNLIPGKGDPLTFYLSGESSPTRWGSIEIFVRGVPPECCLLDQSGPRQPAREFAISLQPRTSRWRYFIISRSSADRTYGDCQIMAAARPGNGAAPSAFEQDPAPQKILDKDAWVFISKDPIPLYERPGDHYEFVLKSEKPSPGAVGTIKLPYANPATTRRQQIASNGPVETFSDIYVYL